MSDVQSGGHFRKIQELAPPHLTNYAQTYSLSEDKVEEIFTWMQDKSRAEMEEQELADAAFNHFEDDFEDGDEGMELIQELAARLRD